MKKIFLFLMLIISVFSICDCNVYAVCNTLDVSAKSAILISADNLSVIFSKNADQKMSMASTTKIMTALLALEASTQDNREVTITQEMVAVEGSSMGLRAGDKLKLEDIVAGMMMASGNDAANAIALTLAGSADNFASMMNKKAIEIGLNNTHFVTPSGLDDDEHYSTAYDMALLGTYAMKNEKFYSIVSQKKATVNFINPVKKCTYSNHNRLLSLYKYCIGIKTGFTKKSGRCLVSCAKKDNKTLIAVTLNAPNDWNDHIKMFEYGFSNLNDLVLDDTSNTIYQPVVGSNIDNIPVKAENSATVSLSKDDIDRVTTVVKLPRFSYAPINVGDTLGVIEYRLDDCTLATVKLKAIENAPLFENRSILSDILKFFNLG